MLTCLCDAFYGEAAIATVKVLEHVGCEVVFEKGQTCCGQPPFNAGDWKSASAVARKCSAVFKDAEKIVVPSASCAAMVHEGYAMLNISGFPQTFELSQFLLDEVGVKSWPSLPSHLSAVFHQSCHGRMIHLGDCQARLLSMVGNLELKTLSEPDQCCGFGGAFSVTHSESSSRIGETKLDDIALSGAKTVVSGDMGCLMHLQGLSKRLGRELNVRHYAEILVEAL